jgi:hypothetical protein
MNKSILLYQEIDKLRKEVAQNKVNIFVSFTVGLSVGVVVGLLLTLFV